MTTCPISRRGVLALGGVASLASALTACSTAVQPSANSSSGAGGTSEMVLWTWPEGFAQQVLDSVKTKFPELSLRQDVIGGDFKQKLSVTLQGKENKPSITL